MNKLALILGVTGQDGSYLAQLLVSKGYTVVGTTRCINDCNISNLKYLSLLEQIQLIELNSSDFNSVFSCLSKYRPDEVYHLSGQSSVGISFSSPSLTIDSFFQSSLNFLEAIRLHFPNIRFYSASSSECFGSLSHRADEMTPFNPLSPYAYAKCMVHDLIKCYRSTYDIFCVSGFLFNHDSELRPSHFVTQKIARSVASIYLGLSDSLVLGNTSIIRDWGYAPDYVDAMWLMLQHHTPEDFCICTNNSLRLSEYIDLFFLSVGLESKKYIKYDHDLMRTSDILFSAGSSDKAFSLLGWKSVVSPSEISSRMVKAQIRFLSL